MTQKNICDQFGSVDRTSGERLLPRRELRKVVPVSDMTIWRWQRHGHFPKHLSINGRNYWRLSEIWDWMDRQPRARHDGLLGGSDQ